MTWSWELSSSYDSSSKFWCKHMAPNFGIKVILFQNYRVCIPDRSAVTGRESWSGVYCLSSPMSTHEPMLQNFLQEHHCFMGTWIHLSRPAIKCLSDPGESNSTIQLCFPSICPLECFWVRRTRHKFLSSSFPVTEKSAGHLLGRWLLPFSVITLLTGRCDSFYDNYQPCGDSDSLQSKEALVGWSLVNVNLSYPSHDIL